jgi:hypothetical protein
MRYCIFDAAERMIVNQVARRANDEKVTEVLIENQFRRNSGIGASDDDGERVLVLRSLRATGGHRLAGGDGTLGESLVASLESTERFSRYDGCRCRIRGDRPTAKPDDYYQS